MRSRCHETLRALRPGLLVTIGFCADYMAEIMSFLRHFEKDIDVALLPRLIAQFNSRLQKLFLDCGILEDIDKVCSLVPCREALEQFEIASNTSFRE